MRKRNKSTGFSFGGHLWCWLSNIRKQSLVPLLFVTRSFRFRLKTVLSDCAKIYNLKAHYSSYCRCNMRYLLSSSLLKLLPLKAAAIEIQSSLPSEYCWDFSIFSHFQATTLWKLAITTKLQQFEWTYSDVKRTFSSYCKFVYLYVMWSRAFHNDPKSFYSGGSRFFPRSRNGVASIVDHKKKDCFQRILNIW